MRDESQLYETLRHRIIRDLHLKNRAPRRRLPSIRRLAETTRLDHRAVARVYARLRDDGLVDIRERSGVFLADGPDGNGARNEGATWLAGVLAGAWERRIPLTQLRATLLRLTELSTRCVWVTPRNIDGTCDELRRDLGLEIATIRLAPADGRPLDPERLAVVLRGYALIITTPELAEPVRAVAEKLERPMIVAEPRPPEFGAMAMPTQATVRQIIDTLIRLALETKG